MNEAQSHLGATHSVSLLHAAIALVFTVGVGTGSSLTMGFTKGAEYFLRYVSSVGSGASFSCAVWGALNNLNSTHFIMLITLRLQSTYTSIETQKCTGISYMVEVFPFFCPFSVC